MQLVEKHIVTGSDTLTDFCGRAKRLYNQTLYYLRQSLFGSIQKFSEYELTGLFAEYDHDAYRALPAQSAQQIVKLCFRNWKSYFVALRDWKKRPSKYLGKPKLPGYKKSQFTLIFTGQQVKIKDGFIHFPKGTLVPLKTLVDHICQVRIIPQSSCHVIEVVYEKQPTDLGLDPSRVLSLDLGLSNLCASANNAGLKPFIVNGNPLKAFNQWYNKKKSSLQSVLEGKRFSSRRIDHLTHYRNCWIEDKLHKISRFIVNYCVVNNIGTVVVGKNDGWKQHLNIGRKNNQHFMLMPLGRLIHKIEYKARSIGIKMILQEESYTSKCDALALESIEKHAAYKGKRIKRGLFQSAVGKLVNADFNGACNIARKVVGDDFMKNLLDSRAGDAPYKLNFAKCALNAQIPSLFCILSDSKRTECYRKRPNTRFRP